MRLLFRRDDDDDDDDYSCTGFCDDGYVRWVVAIIIIIIVISMIIFVWTFSVRRVTGHWGLTRHSARAALEREANAEDDAGVIQDSSRRRRHRNRRRRNHEEGDPVPTYNERPGEGDAGYYDTNGNYVAYEPPPYEPPKAMVRTRNVELDSEDVELDNMEANTENVFTHADEDPLRTNLQREH